MMSLIRREWLRSLFNRLAGLFRHSSLSPSSLGKRVPNLCLGKVGDVGSWKIRGVSSGSSLPGPSPLAAVPRHCPETALFYQLRAVSGKWSWGPCFFFLSSSSSDFQFNFWVQFKALRTLAACVYLGRKSRIKTFPLPGQDDQNKVTLNWFPQRMTLSQSIISHDSFVVFQHTHKKSTTKWKIISIFQVTAAAPKLYDEPLLLPTRRNRIQTIPSELYPGLLGDKAHVASLLLYTTWEHPIAASKRNWSLSFVESSGSSFF